MTQESIGTMDAEDVQGRVDLDSLAQGYGAAVLGERHMVSVLLLLLRQGPCMKTDIYSKVSTNPRMPEKLDMLENAGLIVQTPDTSTRRVTVSLTPKGIDVATLLEGISGIMSGIGPME